MKTKIAIIVSLGAFFVIGLILFLKNIIELPPFILITAGSIVFLFLNIFEVGKIKEQDFKRLMVEAEELTAKRESQNAINVYKKALKIKSNSFEAYVGKAQCHRMLLEFDNALTDYKSALSIKPDNIYIYFLMGTVEMQLNLHQDALNSFAKAAQMKPEIDDLNYYMGQLYEKTNQIDEAINSFQKYLDGCTECKLRTNAKERLELLRKKTKGLSPEGVNEALAKHEESIQKRASEKEKEKEDVEIVIKTAKPPIEDEKKKEKLRPVGLKAFEQTQKEVEKAPEPKPAEVKEKAEELVQGAQSKGQEGGQPKPVSEVKNSAEKRKPPKTITMEPSPKTKLMPPGPDKEKSSQGERKVMLGLESDAADMDRIKKALEEARAKKRDAQRKDAI